MLPGETSAGFCRRMGWGPGTLIAGSEGSRRDILTITAVGEEAVLGIVRDRKPPREGLWTLRCRDWEVSEDFLSRLAAVIAAAAIQREIDQKPCQKCGGDPLRPAFDGRPGCHAPWKEAS